MDAIVGAIGVGRDKLGRLWDVGPEMETKRVEELPGYRRRIRVRAQVGEVIAMLEDDFHCMAVTLRHDGATVAAVEPLMDRAPWTTCPGAKAKLVETFVGRPLAEVTARREKNANCTHLHDLAVLAAAHAGDYDDGRGALTYDVLTSDPVQGERLLEIRCEGRPVLHWVERDGVLVEPAEIAGQTLFGLRDWINALEEPRREAARLLQWAAIVAHGRTIPLERQSNAREIPPNCYTFQPERAAQAIRNGKSCDFSDGSRVPLAGIDGKKSTKQNHV